MTKRLLSFSKVYRQLFLAVFSGLFLVALMGGGIFYITAEQNPFTAELEYIEVSKNDNIIGSVVPASCESNPINSHETTGVMCACSITATGPCTGASCLKTISWTTNYNPSLYGNPNLRVDGFLIGQVPVSGSTMRNIAPGGQTFRLYRPDIVQLCAVFVPGPPGPTLSFSGSPTSVNYGATTNLTWTATNANTCTASGGWSGAKLAAGTRTQTITPTATDNYALSCTGAGGTVNRNLTINVNAPTVNLTATPATITAGDAVTLSWTVSSASSCTATGNWSGQKTAGNGTFSEVVYPVSSTNTYTLTCTGPSGSVVDTATVTINAPALSLAASPTAVNAGSATTLTWNVFSATSCTASDDWSGAKSATNGAHNQVVLPITSPSTYILSCSGPSGSVVRSATVTINPPALTLTAAPTLIGPGNSSTLTWNVTGATSCTASDDWSGAKSATNGSHSQVVSPTNTSDYTLTCSGLGGSTVRTARVTLPSGIISATSCSIPVNGTGCTSQVSWASNNFLGTRQVLQGTNQFSTNAVGANIDRTVTPDNAIFTLRDSGSSFEDTTTASVTCASGSQWAGTVCIMAPIIQLSAESSFVRIGDQTTIDAQVTAPYGTQCNFTTGMSNSFVHTGTPATQTYSFSTGPILSKQTFTLRCNSQMYPSVVTTGSVTIEVVPNYEET